jgi:hypothetical protein
VRDGDGVVHEGPEGRSAFDQLLNEARTWIDRYGGAMAIVRARENA